ncbi:MAG TPA: outer membrane lipoprotein carrier protein LolA [Fibrobacteria bacterium]|nr:outer membrane lipoprotein carrier protein LolA [Fibrobacteria bacterium]
MIRPIALLLSLLPASGLALAADSVPPPKAAPSASLAPHSPPAAAPVDDEAREAMRRAIVFHRQAKDLVFKFKAEVHNVDLDRDDTYAGRLLLKDSTRFRLEIPGATYVCDGKDFWEYHVRNQQAVVRSAADLEDRPLPGDVLLRFLDSEPLSVKRVKESGKEYLEMRLDPARAMKNLDSLSVQLHDKDYSVRRISSRDVSGNEARYTLLSVKRNGGIKDREFTFTPPKGAEVVDMR